MKPITINPEYSEQRMSTATGFKTLSEHTQEELVALAIQAKKSKNPALLRCFIVPLPKLSELQGEKVEMEQAQLSHRKPDEEIAADELEVRVDEAEEQTETIES